ncbi:MAG TPA: hypothetical protein PLD47_09055 [Aggregatilineales bacterium]|nr:hypothetical protein [Anaerolineales bacterium]HRE47862.1 hypothetical protein [Aggregatilineales bacterium]
MKRVDTEKLQEFDVMVGQLSNAQYELQDPHNLRTALPQVLKLAKLCRLYLEGISELTEEEIEVLQIGKYGKYLNDE